MDVQISLATTTVEIDRAIDLAERVWGARPISDPMMRALEFAGSYVATAYTNDEMVGMCAGFVGIHDDGLHLHSHLAAVLPGTQGRGVGRALKRHQRDWCLDRGISVVTWTFDPLVRENARFNLHHLGAVGARYLVDLYGEMDDDINRGQPTDRLLMRWDLEGPEAKAALAAPLPTSSGAEMRELGAVDVIDADGSSISHAPTDADLRLIATPSAIVEVRRNDPELALAWRTAVREAMLATFADGLRPVGLTDDHAYICCRTAP